MLPLHQAGFIPSRPRQEQAQEKDFDARLFLGQRFQQRRISTIDGLLGLQLGDGCHKQIKQIIISNRTFLAFKQTLRGFRTVMQPLPMSEGT